MQFFTEIEIPEFPEKIDYLSGIIMMGSCFTNEIGLKLEQSKFKIDINPFGILYNPVSIANSLKILMAKRQFKPGDLYFKDGVWFSFSHHGKFSSNNREVALEQINSRIITGAENLRNAGYLFLTFGTAWAYELKSTGQVVANCHKVPAGEFRRFRLPESEIREVYRNLLEELWLMNPKIKVVFTVSPIRHWKDGAVENQVSKATLILAIHNILEKFKQHPCFYFPSYEIIMDELRDYRFYAEDMLHLSDVAIQHIWEKFKEALVSEEALKIAREVENIQKATTHRPMHRDTPEFRKFLKNSLMKIDNLVTKYPFLNLKLEKEFFEEQFRDF